MDTLTVKQIETLRAEQRALIHENAKLEAQRTANMRRLADIRRLLTGKQVLSECNELKERQ